MTLANPSPVVVAVGLDPTESAVQFALDEARRAGCGVHLVHVVARAHDGPEFVLVTAPDHERVGHQVLGDALERALDAVGDSVPVTSALVHGRVVPAIVSTASDARMVVLQHRHRSGVRRAVTRSVASGVAARARVPVVSVPELWPPRRQQGEAAEVAVGVEEPQRSRELLRVAAQAAGERGSSLRVVHAWHLGAAENSFPMSPTDVDHWAETQTGEIRAVYDELGDAVRGVPVQIVVQHERPAEALVAASREAGLLVLGRHDPVVPVGSHVGPVVRAVLQDAECPVMLVDPRALVP